MRIIYIDPNHQVIIHYLPIDTVISVVSIENMGANFKIHINGRPFDYFINHNTLNDGGKLIKMANGGGRRKSRRRNRKTRKSTRSRR